MTNLRSRLTALLLAALMLLLPLCGCKGDANSLERVLREKRIVFGTTPDYLPMSFADENGEPQGISVDIGRKIAARLNVEAEYIFVEQEDAAQYLADGTIDCYLNLAAPDIRTSAQIETVDSLMDCRQVVVVPRWSKVTRLVDLAGSRVCVVSGTDACTALDGAPVFKSSLSGVNYSEDYVAVLRELTGSQSAAAIVDEPQFLYACRESRDKFIIIDEPLATGDYVLAFGYRQSELSARVQSIYDDMNADGTVSSIKAAWIG